MKIFVVTAIALGSLFLSACSENPEKRRESREQIERQLPRGCKIVDYGLYDPGKPNEREIRIVAIQCEHYAVTTQMNSFQVPSGKSSYTQHVSLNYMR